MLTAYAYSAVNVSNELLFEFSDCFGEIGTLRNTQHIEIEDNVTPVVTPVRRQDSGESGLVG